MADAPKAHESLSTEARRVPVQGTPIPFISIFIGHMASEDVRRFLEAERNNTPVDLFVRKNKDDKESKSFYYLGRMAAGKGEDIVMESGSQAVEIFWNLETPVREDIYEYITSEVL